MYTGNAILLTLTCVFAIASVHSCVSNTGLSGSSRGPGDISLEDVEISSLLPTVTGSQPQRTSDRESDSLASSRNSDSVLNKNSGVTSSKVDIPATATLPILPPEDAAETPNETFLAPFLELAEARSSEASPEKKSNSVESNTETDLEGSPNSGLASSPRPVARPALLSDPSDIVSTAAISNMEPVARPTETMLAPMPKDVSAVAPPPSFPKRVSTPARAGGFTRKIIGLFETKSKRWVLFEDDAGQVRIMKPGDQIGAGVISSIDAGTMTISVGDSFMKYSTGDRF